MTMGATARKFALATHLFCSVGWVGAVLVYLALGILGATGEDPQAIRTAWIAMELAGWFVIVPLALGALATGLVISIGTPWGLFRHYWVLASSVLTVFAVIVLLLHMPAVTSAANVARNADDAGLRRLGGDLFHPSVGLLVLLAVLALNIYKPRGLTPYGWRRQQQERALPRPETR